MNRFISKAAFAVIVSCLAACSEDNTEDENSVAGFSGDLMATLVEDSTLNFNGNVLISDPDEGESNLVAQVDVSGQYGTFSIMANGDWTYLVDNSLSVVQELSADQSLTETITVSGVDGTTTNLTITINGVDDTPVVTGDLSQTITFAINASTSGSLSVSGGDSGENVLVAKSETGALGQFEVGSDGNWTYQLTATSLDATKTESFSVDLGDGSSVDVLLTVKALDLAKGSIGDNDSVPNINCTTTVTTTSALESAANYSMTPGETLCLAGGDYSGLDLEFGGTGTELLPITVAAAVPGEVTITGEVSVAMSGEFVVLQGFIFKDGSVDNSVIQTRGNSSIPCNNCRITENSLINMDEGIDETSKWVYIYGNNNRIDHNWFSGKTTRGALLVIDRYVPDGVTVDDNFAVDRAQIDHNYFGDRPPVNGKAYAESSDNEYEGIRIGTSDSHMGDSYSVVEYNYFEQIEGEAEVISNKSGHNTIRHNTIRNSYGSIVTRHGEYATIENNFVFGDDHPFSGGIRLVDGYHTVTNNYIEGARYENSNWNGGIVLTSGNNSSSNGYQNLENVLIAHNTIVDSVNSLNVFGGKESTEADEIYFVNNIIANAIGPVIKNAEDMPTNSVFEGNLVYGQAFSDDPDLTTMSGMSFTDAMLEIDDSGLYRPSDSSPDLTSNDQVDTGEYALPLIDMDGQTRGANSYIGADDVQTGMPILKPLTAELVGPLSYTPPMTEPHVKKVSIPNFDFDDGDFTGWTNVGGEITTVQSEVFSRGISLKLDSTDDKVSQVIAVEANKNYTFSAFVNGGGVLTVDVGDTSYSASQSGSEYKFTTVSFNSGDATQITIQAALNQQVANKAPLLNGKFDNKNYDDWTFYEGTGIGQVQDSSNSSDSTDGSVKFKYDDSKGDNGTPYDPYIAQTVEVLANTEYTFTMYNLLKSSHTGSTVLFGAFEGDDSSLLTDASATIMASKDSDYDALDAAGADKADDNFLKDTVTINTGDNTTITVFAQFNSTTGDEIRVDAFELSYFGSPEAGTVVYFDSFRLVSHDKLDD